MINIDKDALGMETFEVLPMSAGFVRSLPPISIEFTNPKSTALKAEQEARVAAIAVPQDDAYLVRQMEKYTGAVLYDNDTRARQKLFRVTAVQFVRSYNSSVPSCWEATCEPVFRDAANACFKVANEHIVSGSTLVRSNALQGYALYEFSNGIDNEPVYLPWVDQYISYFNDVIMTANADQTIVAHSSPQTSSMPTSRSRGSKRKFA